MSEKHFTKLLTDDSIEMQNNFTINLSSIEENATPICHNFDGEKSMRVED